MISQTYRAMRRRTASFLNGYVMPRFGFKLVRSYPDRFNYKRLGSAKGRTRVSVSGMGSRAEISLREGTSDWMTFDQVFIEEDYNLRALARYGELTAHFEAIAKRGVPLIVDLGANIGLSPLYFSMTWPGSRVVAVEPNDENFAMLSDNIADIAAIEAVHAGVTSTGDALRISDLSVGTNAFRTRPAGADGHSIPGITVPQILAAQRERGAIPFAVKVDIEGAESDLFAGNLAWIDEIPLIVVELHDWLYPGEGTARNFLAAMAERERDFVYLDENVFSIANPLPISAG